MDKEIFERHVKLQADPRRIRGERDSIYILLDVLVCSIAVYFYELCSILTSP